MKNKHLFYVSLVLFFSVLLLFSGCGANGSQSVSVDDKPVPEINLSYIFVDHQSPIMVALNKGEEFKDFGVYFKPIIEKELYNLMSGEDVIAEVELIVAKSGSELATLFAQRHVDIGSFSITAGMTGVDTETPFKILAPVHTEGLGLVFPKDSELDGWDDFLNYVSTQDELIKIGYHSPTSAPLIVFEGALHREGINYTHDPNDYSADILLVDLRATSNFIPALNSGEVDAWVGPSPHPQVAKTTGVGKIVMDLRDLPPSGYWHDFPCCVIAATDELIENNPEIPEKFMELTTKSAQWCNDNSDEAAIITAEWVGIPEEAAKLSTVVYTTDPSENWMRGAEIILDVLNDMGNFTGLLEDKKLEEVHDLLFDFSFVE